MLAFISAKHISNLVYIRYSFQKYNIKSKTNSSLTNSIIKYPYEYFNIIVDFFGDSIKKETLSEQSVVQDSVFSRDYELRGIIKLGADLHSIANIYERKTRKTILISKNDVLGDGYFLTEFFTDRVKFEKNNNVFYLLLNEEENQDDISSFSGNRSAVTSKNTSELSAQNLNHIISRTDLDKQIFSNLNEILTSVTIAPNVNVQREMEGVRVVNLRKDSIIYNFGVREGDIILRVNGHVIDNMETGFKLWMNVKDEPYVYINLLRNGQPMTISFEVDY